MKLPLEIIVGSNYVKYDKLSELIFQTYAGSNATVLNIFVDLYSIFKPLFSNKDSGITYEKSSDVELSADIINLCAHYRSFFNRQGVETRFYLIFGTNTPETNQLLCPGYNKDFIGAYVSKNEIREMVIKNLELLKVLCESLPGIYFFDIGTNEVSGFIEFLLRKFNLNIKDMNPNMENMVLTKDILPLQLVSSGCTILRPKKSKGIDNSFIINHNNFWTAFMVQMRNNVSNSAMFRQLDIGYFPNILCMTRVPERCMSSIKSIPTAYDILSKGVELGYLQNSDYSQSTINKVLEILGVNMNYSTLEMRWKAISSKFAADYIIPNNPILANAQLIDIYDPNGVRQICARYYDKSPIDLDRL